VDAEKARGRAAGEGERGTSREEATGRGGEGSASLALNSAENRLRVFFIR